MVVLVNDNGTVQFHTYVPNNDSDADGVPNTRTRSRWIAPPRSTPISDGYPDAWNAGRSQADSTTGLTLDAFPSDSACWSPLMAAAASATTAPPCRATRRTR